ncbi:MAG: hypothetical protein E7425_00385 [Ruminococcaceae bacterium]|nr:hypothetical protein [Oscillospiraceae bacterium]
MARIAVTERIAPVGVALLRAAGHEVVELDLKGGVEPDPAAVGDADALLVRIAEVTRALLEACPGLKLISKHGVGVDNVDMDAAVAVSRVAAQNVIDFFDNRPIEGRLL